MGEEPASPVVATKDSARNAGEGSPTAAIASTSGTKTGMEGEVTTPKKKKGAGFWGRRREELKKQQEKALVRNKQLVQVNAEDAGRDSRNIQEEPYYHGFINVEEVSFLLNKDGNFLVRITEVQNRSHYVVSVRKGSTIYNVLIRRTKTKRLYWVFNYAFKTVTDLIQYHYRNYEPIDEKMIYLKIPAFRAEWQLNHEQVVCKAKLGEGSFGVCHKGYLQRKAFETPVEVAVKSLHAAVAEDLSIQDKTKFLREASLMLALDHPNIVRLFGICATRDPIMLVMELCEGSLLGRIKEHEEAVNGNGGKMMSDYEKGGIVLGAAKGLGYLHSLNIIHRDIASRNCLIKKGLAQITDFGMSCIGQLQDKKGHNKPIRWMAPESLKKGISRQESDVFSFGSMIYEIWSFGKNPYYKVEDNLVVRRIIMKGDEKDKLVPDEALPPWAETLIQFTREMKPEDRPTFAHVVEFLEQCNVKETKTEKSSAKSGKEGMLELIIQCVSLARDYKLQKTIEKKKGSKKEYKDEKKPLLDNPV